MTQKVFKPKTREEWLNRRSSFLGGSEIATVVGCNPFQTPYQLWEIKTGKAPKFEGNNATEMGNLLEPVVAERFESVTGHRVIKASADDVVYINNDYPFLAGTPDRFYYPEEKDGKRVLECKSTSMTVDPDQIPQMWFIQTLFYMGLTGMDKGAIAWLSGNRGFTFDYLPIGFDSELYDMLVQAGVSFWQDCVEADIPPDAMNVDDVQRMYRSHVEGKTVDADLDLYNQHVELASLKKIKALTDEKITTHEEVIKMAYKDAEAIKYGGEILSTWKQAKASVKLDSKKLKVEMPEVFKRYSNETEGSRRFLLKV